MPSLQIVYASTSGHTEHVVSVLAEALAGVDVLVTRVERATPETLRTGGALLLASGTWNTGGIEGQLNPHMHAFVHGPAKDVDLKGRKVAVVALGDARYRYTANAGKLLEEFVAARGGELLCEHLTIVNEPYGQEASVRAWAETLFPLLP